MTITTVDLAVFGIGLAVFVAFVGGLFVGARLVRGASAQSRPGASSDVGELVKLVLAEVVAFVRELRDNQAESTAAPRRRWLRRR